MKDDVKLGQLIDGDANRDAVHVAVCPVTAIQILKPGQHVGIVGKEGKDPLVGVCDNPIGIVDPFIRSRNVKRGQRFYLFLYPGTITTLRHQWEHPAFVKDVSRDPEGEHQRFFESFADKCCVTVPELLQAAERYARNRDHTNLGENENYKDVTDREWEKFWHHYESATGNEVDDDYRTYSFFSCAC